MNALESEMQTIDWNSKLLKYILMDSMDGSVVVDFKREVIVGEENPKFHFENIPQWDANKKMWIDLNGTVRTVNKFISNC